MATWLTLPGVALSITSEAQLRPQRQALNNEIQFHRMGKVELSAGEACPSWLELGSEGSSCKRLDVVYRDAYLSGILVQHERASKALTIYQVGHESTPLSVEDAGKRRAAPLAEQSDQLVYIDATSFITSLYAEGSDVLILFMPGLGLAPPDWASDQINRVHRVMGIHNSFALLDFPGDSAATYFLAPAKAFLDEHGNRYRQVRMVGRSGGGWATTLAAAVDERIQCSVSFFGSLPMRLRLPQTDDARNDLGDFEQFGLYLFKQTDYLDLYALGTTGGRTHVEVYNEKDDCCFSGGTKGIRVPTLFSKSYPTTKGFQVVILPRRSEKDHGNLDDSALRVVQEYCPIR